jgi:hypothetical protein
MREHATVDLIITTQDGEMTTYRNVRDDTVTWVMMTCKGADPVLVLTFDEDVTFNPTIWYVPNVRSWASLDAEDN